MFSWSTITYHNIFNSLDVIYYDVSHNDDAAMKSVKRSSGKTFNYYLMKANRVVVWVLLLLTILYIATGYGLTKPSLLYSLSSGILNYQISFYLHTVLDVPLMILLLLHVIIEVKFSLMRWGFRNQRLLNILMFILASTLMILILYVDGARR